MSNINYCRDSEAMPSYKRVEAESTSRKVKWEFNWHIRKGGKHSGGFPKVLPRKVLNICFFPTYDAIFCLDTTFSRGWKIRNKQSASTTNLKIKCFMTSTVSNKKPFDLNLREDCCYWNHIGIILEVHVVDNLMALTGVCSVKDIVAIQYSYHQSCLVFYRNCLQNLYNQKINKFHSVDIQSLGNVTCWLLIAVYQILANFHSRIELAQHSTWYCIDHFVFSL